MAGRPVGLSAGHPITAKRSSADIGWRNFVFCFEIDGVTNDSSSSYSSVDIRQKFMYVCLSVTRMSLKSAACVPNCVLRVNHGLNNMIDGNGELSVSALLQPQ